jgi:hypothetical protein
MPLEPPLFVATVGHFRNLLLYYGGLQRDEHIDFGSVLRYARHRNGCQ